MRTAKLALFLGWNIVIGSAWGQVTQVSGRIFDAESGVALPYVNVSFSGSGEGVASNAKGVYFLSTSNRPGRLTASFLGYETQSVELIRGITQVRDIALEPRNISLNAAEVRPNRKSSNPAKPLMERVLEAKRDNSPRRTPAMYQRAYTRIELDINDISKKQTERWYWGAFRWVFDYIDTSEVRPALPFILGEVLSETRSSNEPKKMQRTIESARMSGKISGENSAELNARFPEINLYDNQLLILDRTFTSPLHDRGAAHYRYYILDTLEVSGRTAFHLTFIPRRKGEMTFEGELWIDTLSLALSKVDARLSQSANVNFIRSLTWQQDYEPIQSAADSTRWMLQHEAMVMDISLTGYTWGAYLRRTIDITDNAWAISWPESDWTEKSNALYDRGSSPALEQQWSNMRPLPLLNREAGIYEMVDSVQSMPQYRMVRRLGYFAATGFVLAGPVEVGAWWSALTKNPIEGQRFRLDIRTSNAFSTRVMPRIFIAYGRKDDRWKAGVSSRFIIRKSPRSEAFIQWKRDLAQLGMAGLFEQGEIFTSLLSTSGSWQLSEITTSTASVLHFFGSGLSAFIAWENRQIRPLNSITFLHPETEQIINQLATTEATVILRHALGERFVSGQFEQVSLGTEWPILTATTAWGIPGILGSKYQYLKASLQVEDDVRMGFWGKLNLDGEIGRYFGTAPFILMEVVPANGTLFMSPESFNLLQFYEKVTDRWVKGSLEWHAEGLVFNHIPLLRRLGLREVIGAKAIAGTWDTKHESLAALPNGTSGLDTPYIELGAGIENIFRFLRIDAIYRVDEPLNDSPQWGIRIGFSAQI